MFKKLRNLSLRPMQILVPMLILCVIAFFLFALSGLEGSQGEEGRQQLETSIRRAAVACYAVEGVYPPTLEYLEENYGIQIDEDRSAVFYEIFASNIMPEITVLEK